ncbi:MAG TPA: ABC transporter substrate-binding protein [Actinophytocola sp.]|uniref:ABC transporter substrate-binding protein n=1 Tax=Actinophytocola sp. TaxID=1872138 RepID=UPI002DDCE5DB|nr:ABC transporter substrate-binding protein [Actinophytocola sp.]HEV2778313.1 ABC transporter substrate-binding protein [Actinophytocola sp.]
MRNRSRSLILLAAASLALVACTEGGDGAGPPGGVPGGGQQAAQPASYPRNETLFTSGTQWGPPVSWNPIATQNYATGTIGFVYETLFLYDPQTDKYEPWLAESGNWTSDTTYEVKLRDGVNWTDGKPLTADDVVFTAELGKMKSVPYSNLWNYLQKAEATDPRTVKFTFGAQPSYQQWANWVYFNAIVPKHLWQGRSEQDVTAGANDKPVGTGPYLYQTHDQDRMVWVKNDNWWGKQKLNLDPKPKYIVDIVNSSNEAALGLLLQGGIDLSNNFLPGISTLVRGGYKLETYFPEAPYMLSANTTWLVMNTKKAPMNNAAFRRALANSIDINKIVNGVYGQIVKPASPTGLLPIWDKYIDQAVVDELGFSFDTNRAKSILAEGGFRDTNGDGLVENTDGSPIELTLAVPTGWTDWMEAIRTIAEGAKAAGINIKTEFPAQTQVEDMRESGSFDMILNNERQIDNTPWTYYDYVFRLPIQQQQTTVNFGRYENQQAWDLVNQLDKTKVDDVAGMKAVTSQLQRIQLTEMPLIPLWYNGLWAQYSNAVWTNWPSAKDNAPKHLPTTWRGYMQRGAIKMLSDLKPAPPAK